MTRMTQATSPQSPQNPASEPDLLHEHGRNGHLRKHRNGEADGAMNGSMDPAASNGHSNGQTHAPEPAQAGAERSDDPRRVDVQAARRQSSARRRPTHQVEAGSNGTSAPAVDADEIVDDDPTQGAFSQTLTMSGRTPQSSPTPAPRSEGENPAQRPAPRQEPLPQPREGTPQVVGRVGERRTPGGEPAALPPKAGQFNRHVCPFCGQRRDDAAEKCPSCGMPDNAEARSATVSRIGPWFVLQARNPSAPGMRFNVLRELVRSGQITAGSVVRGPTTQQLWTYAARVRGLAHYFGLCWSCSRRLPKPKPGEEPDDFCIYCGALQEAPTNPDQQLEALGTSETVGAGLSGIASQVQQMNEGQAPRARGLEVRETNHPSPSLARRPHIPKPLPPMPRDGGDALLTTRDLATAFNLERKSSALGRIPWLSIIVGVLVLALFIAGLVVAYQIFWPAIQDAVTGT